VFKGNYAAVIITDEWLSDELMQNIATENNLSETAFVKRLDAQSFKIRWFSPITEIDFCGHATLASAFVIFKEALSANAQDSTQDNTQGSTQDHTANGNITELTFYADAVGQLTIRQMENGYIEMTFPNQKPAPVTAIPDALFSALSIAPTAVLRNQQCYFAVYDNEQDVHEVETNVEQLMLLAPYDVAVTAKADTGSAYDFVSRYFWPVNGGDEDPVTGSIHTGLAPYWAEQLAKNELVAYQASKRGGKLHCRVSDDNVIISGQAVQYLEGYIEF
jgi:PhzF family phenazine biosynthesis protein